MKKYTLFLSVMFSLALFITLLSFGANSASASNCASGEFFNSTTGQACGTSTVVVGCSVGYLFSSTTGQPCSGANSVGGSQQFGAAGIALTMNQFNSLYKNSFVVGSRGDDVRALQQFLKDQGYYSSIVDGKYGAISARAVKDFETDNVSYFSSTNSQTPATLNFSCNPTNVPLDVICGAYGLSVNSTYSIDFGDGSNSGSLTLIPPAHAFGTDGPNNKMIDNPSHTYTSPGNYTISFYKDSTIIGRSIVAAVSNGSTKICSRGEVSVTLPNNSKYSCVGDTTNLASFVAVKYDSGLDVKEPYDVVSVQKYKNQTAFNDAKNSSFFNEIYTLVDSNYRFNGTTGLLFQGNSRMGTNVNPSDYKWIILPSKLTIIFIYGVPTTISIYGVPSDVGATKAELDSIVNSVSF